MASLPNKPRIVRQSIAFRPDQLAEAKRIVLEVERHGNLSRFMQELLDAELDRRQAGRPSVEQAA